MAWETAWGPGFKKVKWLEQGQLAESECGLETIRAVLQDSSISPQSGLKP